MIAAINSNQSLVIVGGASGVAKLACLGISLPSRPEANDDDKLYKAGAGK